MLYNFLSRSLEDNIIVLIASAVAFMTTFAFFIKPFKFLPRDGGKFVISPEGKKISINENSNGKVTGVGFVFVLVYVACVNIFLPLNIELSIYMTLTNLMMLFGFMDDMSKTPWGELTKGLLDLALAIVTAVVFVLYNSSNLYFLGFKQHMPPVVYVILAVALIWGSINVTNCSDGVDGLCGTVSVIELMAIVFIFGDVLGIYSNVAVLLAFTIVAYLAYNWFPSTVLMGDAGSRTIGFTIALLCMKTKHPYAFILLSMVFLFDGGLGLVKLAVMRSIGKPFLKNILLPFHDELRKKRGWSVPKIVIFFSVCEVFFVLLLWMLLRFLSS